MTTGLTMEQLWLQQFVGEWSYRMEAETGSGGGPMFATGPESVRALGGWVVCEAEGFSPENEPMKSIMTLGYDPERGRFTGTFIGSTMTHLWIYDGAMDAGGVLTLDTEGPSYTGEDGTARYRDTIEFQDHDHRVQTSSYQRQDGTWHQFMTIQYQRPS